MDQAGKIEVFERALDAWNRGELTGVTAELSEDHEWDLSSADIPGEIRIARGHEEYLGFAERWRDMLGPTQVQIAEAMELDDGRLFLLLRQSGTGASSGADVEIDYVQIITFEGEKATRTEVYTDPQKARAAAGLDPATG
jgi:ketosteroid isomerase-like protein